MLNRFFLKHRAFEWEREFRLAISLRTAEEYWGCSSPARWRSRRSRSRDADLYERIVLGSTTDEEERACRHRVVRKLGDRLEVHPSSENLDTSDPDGEARTVSSHGALPKSAASGKARRERRPNRRRWSCG